MLPSWSCVSGITNLSVALGEQLLRQFVGGNRLLRVRRQNLSHTNSEERGLPYSSTTVSMKSVDFPRDFRVLRRLLRKMLSALWLSGFRSTPLSLFRFDDCTCSAISGRELRINSSFYWISSADRWNQHFWEPLWVRFAEKVKLLYQFTLFCFVTSRQRRVWCQGGEFQGNQTHFLCRVSFLLTDKV